MRLDSSNGAPLGRSCQFHTASVSPIDFYDTFEMVDRILEAVEQIVLTRQSETPS